MPSHLTSHIAQLREAIGGRVTTPGDDDYDRARRLFYGGLDNHPAVIVRPADAGEVSAVVNFARETGVDLAVRSGGHGFLGHAGLDDGIVLDLGDLRGLDVDVEGRTAWAGAGLTTGEYTAAVAHHGLATGFGDTGSVGIGGLTVGGGLGLLARKHGLTIDQLLAAEIVTADGEVRRIDGDSEPDLFWAIRGGGGNLGVVTRFQFRLHDLPSIVGGYLFLPVTPEVIAGFVEAAQQAPDELSTIANISTAAPPLPMIPPEAHGQPIVFSMLVYAGDAAEGERAIAPFRALAKPIADLVGPKSYVEMFPEEEEDAGPSAVAETLFRDHVDVATARTILDHLERAPTPMAVAQLRVLGGAVARVSADATAYAHRERQIMVNVAALFFEDPADTRVAEPWVREFAKALDDGRGGGYVNFLGRDDEASARAAFPGPTWDRLAAIKRTWDPDNLFRRNVNVPPAAR